MHIYLGITKIFTLNTAYKKQDSNWFFFSYGQVLNVKFYLSVVLSINLFEILENLENYILFRQKQILSTIQWQTLQLSGNLYLKTIAGFSLYL